MKFFSKLYISMLLILTVALGVTEYFIVALSLDSSVDNQVEASLKQHQLVKYAIQADMVSAMQGGYDIFQKRVMKDIASQTSDAMLVELVLEDEKGSLIYSSRQFDLPSHSADEGRIGYDTVDVGGKKLLFSYSTILQSGRTLNLVTINDISGIYNNITQMQTQFLWVFATVITLGVIFSGVFSILITRPIYQLTKAGKAFSDGDYSGRVTAITNDEIGELANVYNNMADTIEDKINALELAVKQREDFTAAFAHELKTPMTSIIGYADTLYQKDLSETEARAAAGFIVNEGMRLEALSFKLLELMTLNNNDFLLEEIQMSDFLKDISDTIKPAAAKKNIRMIFDFEDGYCKIEFDLFKTLVLNLIDNAMKSGTDSVAVLSQAKDGQYMIAIVDHGRGIPKEELRRVTEAFYMVDKARSRKEHGAGLGLALCEKIAEIHGTRLDIRSREGEGTAIRIKLNLLEGSDD